MKPMRQNNVILKYALLSPKIKDIEDSEIIEHLFQVFYLIGGLRTHNPEKHQLEDIIKKYRLNLWNYSIEEIEYAFRLSERGEIISNYNIRKDRLSFQMINDLFQDYLKYQYGTETKEIKDISPSDQFRIDKQTILEKWNDLNDGIDIEISIRDYDFLDKYCNHFNPSKDEKHKAIQVTENYNQSISDLIPNKECIVKAAKEYLVKEFLYSLKINEGDLYIQ